MFGPLSHFLDSFPVLWEIFVFLNISQNFVVKLSFGFTKILIGCLKMEPLEESLKDLNSG